MQRLWATAGVFFILCVLVFRQGLVGIGEQVREAIAPWLARRRGTAKPASAA